MKIDRLMAILIILLQNKKVTASYLARRFEVSPRTISRDIEDICKAGVPVVTLQGANGGITIPDSYKMDKTLFTAKELRAVYAGLSTLDSVAQDQKIKSIMDKFVSRSETIPSASHMIIDLSSHYKNTLAPKIEELQNAIEMAATVSFLYYSPSGEKVVNLDPYVIVFQWASWYVLGWSHSHEDFRMYKLNRLWQLQNTGAPYPLREMPEQKLKFNDYFTSQVQAVIYFDPKVKYRLIEEYGPDCCRETEDGRLRFEFSFTSEEYLMDWVMSFGSFAQLAEPSKLRLKIRERLIKTLDMY